MSDIAELFARDPLSLTDDDIATMVTRLRQERIKFTQTNRTQRAKKEKESPLQNLTLDLEGL